MGIFQMENLNFMRELTVPSKIISFLFAFNQLDHKKTVISY